ncbi:MAG TPA: cyclic lactone autoinducer peptide [Candidatus Fimousia stercorigallinarum]|nr:cyclic lactone autoinducer peptide [Candidatus Fimousia stercorigallinarum]
MKSKVIRIMSNLFIFAAMVFATAPCNGKWHEPEVPVELRENL